MTDEHDAPEMEAVRRLLADARHTGPIPDDVRERLDGVLAGLASESSGRAVDDDGADIVPLTGRGRDPAAGRRRRAVSLLAAAAVIVVGGVVVAQHAGSSAGPTATAGGDAANTASGANAGKSPATPSATTRHPPQSLADGLVEVHPRTVTHDALQARTALERRFAARDTGSESLRGAACVPPPPHGHVLAARYRHQPAALVYQRPSDGRQVVDLVLCGTSQPLRSVTLPAP